MTTQAMLTPEADIERVNEWAERQHEFDYRSFMQLRELLGELECMGTTIRRYDRENGTDLAEQVREARFIVESREIASDNMLRAVNGLPAREMPEWTEPEDDED